MAATDTNYTQEDVAFVGTTRHEEARWKKGFRESIDNIQLGTLGFIA